MKDSAVLGDLLEQIVQRANSAYSLPAVAMEVLELTSHPKVDVRALKECLEKDPALTSKILRVVNSSLFGLSRQVSDLNQALALLGTKPLKLLVLGFSLPEELFDGVEGEVLSRYWRKTLIKAVACREISETLWKRPGDEAFIAGLLQNIGHLVLVRDLGASYVKFVQRVQAEGADLAVQEHAALGFDHASLSARLLAHWNLPVALVNAVAAPRSTAALKSLDDEQGRLPRILHLAELTAAMLTDRREAALLELLDAGQAYCGLTLQSIETLVDELEQKIPPLAEVLSLDVGDGTDYRELLLRSREQMAAASEEIAVEHLQQRIAADVAELQQAAQRAARCKTPRRPAPAQATEAAVKPASSTKSLTETMPFAAGGGSLDPGLEGRVAVAVANCRRSRCALSLLMTAIDDLEELVMLRGPDGAEQSMLTLENVVDAVADEYGPCVRAADNRVAVVLENCDRQAATELARRLVHDARCCGPRDADGAPMLTVSVGVATLSLPSKNFPPQELIDAAERCLYGAQSSGGDKFKSIEIY